MYLPWDLDAIWGLDTDGNQTNYSGGLMSNGFFDRLATDCTTNGFVATAKTRYNALRNNILTTNHIMEMVQNQYDELVAAGVYEREHEAWPAFTVDAGQLDYMSKWMDDRFYYLDNEINAACGTWGIEASEPDEGPTPIAEIFPNPAKDRINIRFAEAGDATVRLFDMTCRLVYSSNASAEALVIPTQGLAKGIYTLLVNRAGKQEVSRVAVQ